MLSPVDDSFHQPRFNDFTWAETNWFSFVIPEENKYGSIHVIFRPNLGVVQCVVAIWSKHCRSVLDVDYLDGRVHMTMPRTNLDDYALPNGLRVRVLEPLRRYRVDYDGASSAEFHLEFEALMPAVEASEIMLPKGAHFSASHGIDATTAGSIGHIDQTAMATGFLILDGKRSEISFPVNRDHSWSPRPETGRRPGNFDEGYFGPDFGFHVQTESLSPQEASVVAGYILMNGQVIRLREGKGRYEMDRWLITSLEYDLTDEGGTAYHFDGEATATFETPTYLNQYIVAGLVRWEHQGRVGWGDFHSHWSIAALQRLEREGLGSRAI